MKLVVSAAVACTLVAGGCGASVAVDGPSRPGDDVGEGEGEPGAVAGEGEGEALGGEGEGEGDVDDGCATQPTPPAHVLFIGNSFTQQEGVTDQLRELVLSAGLPEPAIVMRAIGGQTLEGHRADPDPAGAPALVAEGWDVVVLQEHSLRPTDAVGPAEQFKVDATWFHQQAKAANPNARVVLYETWARQASHAVYPGTFADPFDMQEQLRFHYEDAAFRHLPEHGATDVTLARAGDAWERQLTSATPLRLHAADDYHQNVEGAYLNALVLFGTIYGRRTDGLTAAFAQPAAAPLLQAAADEVTNAARPSVECLLPLAVGDELRADFGALPTDGWLSHVPLRGITGALTTTSGAATSVSVATTGFVDWQTGGRPDNDLGLPPTVTQDTLYLGTFDGHAAAAPMRGEVVLYGVPAGRHRLSLFASRDGDDEGHGRLTRYEVGDADVDLDVVDNRDRLAIFEDVQPDEHGRIVVTVSVSPLGNARFAYVGALFLTKTAD